MTDDERKDLTEFLRYLGTLDIPADATPEQARNIIFGSPWRAAKERNRKLRAIRNPCSQVSFEFDEAKELAESIGYDTSKTYGEKAVAYLMRADLNTVRALLRPDVSVTDDDDDGDNGIDVEKIIADAMKP